MRKSFVLSATVTLLFHISGLHSDGNFKAFQLYIILIKVYNVLTYPEPFLTTRRKLGETLGNTLTNFRSLLTFLIIQNFYKISNNI